MTTGLLGTAAVPDRAAAAKTEQTEQYRYTLDAVPHYPTKDGGSDASGRVKISRNGDRIRVQLTAEGRGAA